MLIAANDLESFPLRVSDIDLSELSPTSSPLNVQERDPLPSDCIKISLFDSILPLIDSSHLQTGPCIYTCMYVAV